VDYCLNGGLVGGHIMETSAPARKMMERGHWKEGYGKKFNPQYFKYVGNGDPTGVEIVWKGTIKVVVKRGKVWDKPIAREEGEGEGIDPEIDIEGGERDHLAVIDSGTKKKTEREDPTFEDLDLSDCFERTEPCLTFNFHYDSTRQLIAKGILRPSQDVEKNITLLRQQIATLQDQGNAAQHNHAALHLENITVRHQLATAQDQGLASQQDTTALRLENTALRQQTAALQDQGNAAQQANNAALNLENTALQQQIATLQAQAETAWQQDNDALDLERNLVNAQLDGLRTQRDAAQTHLNQMQERQTAGFDLLCTGLRPIAADE